MPFQSEVRFDILNRDKQQCMELVELTDNDRNSLLVGQQHRRRMRKITPTITQQLPLLH